MINLTKQEQELYEYITKKRAIKNKIIKLKEKLRTLQNEYNEYSTTKLAKKLWVAPNTINYRVSNLDTKLKK